MPRRSPTAHCRIRRQAIAALPILAAIAAVTPRASAVNYTFSNPNGGAINVSTNFTPVGIPGSADTLVIDDLPRIFTNTTLTVPVNQAIAGIQYSHYGQTSINGPGTLTLQTGTLAFDDAITEAPGSPLHSLFINANIAGAAGLNKSGRGFALLSGTNTYTGGTTISAINPPGANFGDYSSGGLSVTSDAALGASGHGIALNGGTLRFLSNVTSSRAITTPNGFGRIESYGNTVLNGPINATGALVLAGSGSTTFGANVSATLYVFGGTTATLLSRHNFDSGGVGLAGTLNVGNGTTGAVINALNDADDFNVWGGTLNVYAGPSNLNETVSTLGLLSGQSRISLHANVNGGLRLNFASLFRSQRSTLLVTGRDLGSGPLAANRTLLTFTDASNVTLVGGGGTTPTNVSIVPFIVGNANVTGGVSQTSVVDAGLVTYGPNGIRPLAASEYATSVASAAATDNVRISDGVETLDTNATVNALVVRDTLSGPALSGLTGSGALTITSGTVAAVSDLSGEELFIDNALAFGAQPGIVHVLPTSDGESSLVLRGTISGTGGLVKAGHGALFLENANSTYTGGTTINGGDLIVYGDVPATGASALGSSLGIYFNAGANDGRLMRFLAATPGATIATPIRAGETSVGIPDNVVIGTYGDGSVTFSGEVFTGLTRLNLSGGTAAGDVLTLSGTVKSQGNYLSNGLQELPAAIPAFQTIRLTGNNTYTGSTVIRAGDWQAGSNTAFGFSTVYFAGNNTSTQTGAISAFGGPRTLANALVFRAAPVFTGSDALTFTGPVDLGSVNREVYVDNTADTTFSGVTSRGGVVKRGEGRLILSGNNTYNGQTIVYEGAVRAASNNALGVAVGTASPNQATFIINTGSLELSGGISTNEAIFMGSGSIPIAAANPLGNLRSVSGNNTITESIGFDDVGTVGVDAGSTFTLTGDTLDNTGDTTAALRKVGAGTLAVKNVRLNTLDVQAGTVRVNVGTVPTGTSRVSNLTVAPGALFDLTNNALIYDYTATSPQTAVRQLLQQGLIDTTSGGANGAVGYAEAASYFAPGTVFPEQFAGQTFDNTTLLLTYTIAGDATLDKVVNFDDLLTLAKNFNTTNKVWLQGDFNYDANVNFDDLLLLAKAFNTTAPVSASGVAALEASFAAEWALAQSLVPEPSTLAAAALLAPMVRRRRA